MSHEKKGPGSENLRLTVNELKGKQSVRATFRLPKQVIDLLNVVAGQLGIKQKSLFDQLIENSSILGQVAQEARNYSAEKNDRLQKTFVISRSSLLSLNYIAKKEQIPRDILVEVSIRRLFPVIKNELKKHIIRKALLKEMKEYCDQGELLLQKTGNLLSKDDVLYDMIQGQVRLARKNITATSAIVERGLPIEDW